MNFRACARFTTMQRQNPSAVTRDYVFDVEAPAGTAPLLSVFGGKITTYRKLAEHALEKLTPFFPALGPAWTEHATLPGGDMPGADFASFEALLGRDHPFLPASLLHHYARLYGTRAHLLLEGKHSLDALGRHYGANFYEAEADFLRRTEWAMTPEDILFRRTKHHLHLSAREEAAAADLLARAA